MNENKSVKPNHHLWNNNGTFWCHYTIHEDDYTKRRIRVSLRTKKQEEARARRDALLKSVPNTSVRFMPGGLSFALSVRDHGRTPAHAFSIYDTGFPSLVTMNSGD